jgi:hypothetical protein
MKYFIITIDTEGDNIWEYRMAAPGQAENPITTKNACFIPRFQELCGQFDFKPVYLTSYEMALDDFFSDFAGRESAKGNCEIGIHPHAWNTPPYYELAAGNAGHGLPYLIEYPASVMREKFDTLYRALQNKFGGKIVSHRAGRWATNQEYFDILLDYGIQIDCSVTPHVSWAGSAGFSPGSGGPDYTRHPENPYVIKRTDSQKTGESLLEMPVSIRTVRQPPPGPLPFRPFLSGIKKFFTGKTVWLRPNGGNLSDMLALVKIIKKSNAAYLMFMLHSSELMPGGSPVFTTGESIEKLYADLGTLFYTISRDFKGTTLKDFPR